MRRNIPLEPLEATLPTGHHFLLREAYIDEHALRLEYSVRPVLPMFPERSLFSWNWAAVDDLGNFYESCGGAYGPEADGTRTDGVLSLRPFPPAEARRLTVGISPWDGPAFEIPTWLQFDLVLGE